MKIRTILFWVIVISLTFYLISHPRQIFAKRGTALLAAIDNDSIIVAADSRSQYVDLKGNITYNETVQKIHKTSNVYFAIAGIDIYDNGHIHGSIPNLVSNYYSPQLTIKQNAENITIILKQTLQNYLNGFSREQIKKLSESNDGNPESAQVIIIGYQNKIPNMAILRVIANGNVDHTLVTADSVQLITKIGAITATGHLPRIRAILKDGLFRFSNNKIHDFIDLIKYESISTIGVNSNVTWAIIRHDGTYTTGKNY